MPPRVVGLRAEHHRDPTGVGAARPRLSWRVETDEPGWIQAAYEVEVSTGDDSVHYGRIEAADQVLVPWPADPLTSRARRSVRVRVWGRGPGTGSGTGARSGARTGAGSDSGAGSGWSDPLVVEAGLLDPADWTARMIAAAVDPPGDADGPAVLLRREFQVPAPVVEARLYATAFGVYELELNGRRVGDHVLAPGWTSYHHRLRYQTHDVTDLVREGANAIGGWLGDGWYRGRLGFNGGKRAVYGPQTGLLAQL